MTADFLARFGANDIKVPRATLIKIRAVLATTPTARWELAEERTALVDTIDFILNKEQP